MNLDKELINKLVNVTTSASIACHEFIGKNDKIAADKAATDAMRKNLNKLNIEVRRKYLKKNNKKGIF